jgi:heterotetrameric sarcosine oxidase gamma subunit
MAELLKAGPATLRRSPLAHLDDRMRQAAVSGKRAVTLREWPFLTMVSLRVDPGSAAFVRIGQTLGAALPQVCGETSSSGPHAALWLGPDEWLVVSQDDAGALVSSLLVALGEDRGCVVDVSANRTILELSGPSAREVLEKGCPVDLHARSFGPGRAVATTVGPVPLVLWQGAALTYRLLPRSSFADYLARWLLDAMSEYDGPEVP